MSDSKENFTSNYDSNKLKSYSSNSIYVDNNDISTFFDKDFDTLISSINEDMDFIKSFNCLNLNSVFKNLNNKAKIELKYEKDEIQNTYNKLQEKLENINENNETYINEKIGKYDQENYYLRCELDELKIKFQIMKIKKEETEKLYDGNLSKLEKSKGKYKEKEKMYYIAVLEKNEIENNFEGQIFKLKNDIKELKLKHEEFEKENLMLKSDLNLARIKNEEYVIELAEIVHQYQEVSERNRMLEKISKQSRTIEDEFYSLKSQKYMIITLVIIWKIFLLLRIILKRTVNYLNNQDSSTPEQYTVNIKFNMNKISKNNNLANYNFKKQVVATELEIQSNKEDDNQKICNREKESNKLNQNYSANNNNNILITESSFVSDYNSEKFYEETFKTEENDLQITEKRDIIITKKEDQSSHINISKNNKSHRSSKGYTSHTNKSHNSNNSAVSEYESFFDSKFKNDEYDSNAYQCLKNIENNNSNNTMTNENPNNNVKDEKGRRRRYDYNSDVFDTSK